MCMGWLHLGSCRSGLSFALFFSTISLYFFFFALNVLASVFFFGERLAMLDTPRLFFCGSGFRYPMTIVWYFDSFTFCSLESLHWISYALLGSDDDGHIEKTRNFCFQI